MIPLDKMIREFYSVFPFAKNLMPWQITDQLPDILANVITKLDAHFNIVDGIAIHHTAVIERNAILKAPAIIGEDCFISSDAYLRNGVFLDKSVSIGMGCEIKQSIIFSGSSMSHFNYIGNSIIGHNVNFEAGAITANHYNERGEKRISVMFDSKLIDTGLEKFGSLIGDNSKIGANAVLSPGTILQPNTIVKRLELIDQFHK